VNDNKSDNRPNHTRGGNRSVAEPIKDLAFLILENSPTRKTFFKNRRPKHKPIANFRLRQIPNSDLAETCKSAFALTANRTKTFHVKHFCPIGP
jgi:hypothetical protein